MIKIIYEDRYLLVVDKPPGLVVTPSETQKEQTLVDWLKQKYDSLVYHTKDARDRMGVVHRLDKDTSGLLLIAKTQTSFENLQSQFKQRKVKKEYVVLVHGWVKHGDRVEGAIGRNPGNREKFTVMPGIFTSKESKPTFEVSGRWAVTEYEPEKRLQFTDEQLGEFFSDFNKIQMRKLEQMDYGKFTLLSCRPKTGRTHQIRVHLKYANFPVVSDEKYAGRKMVRLDHRWCPRQFLHAKRLGFYHPVSGQWMEVKSQLPEDLKKSLTYLTEKEIYG